MKSEASRAMVRMVTNYLRLGLNLALGLIFVPVIIAWLGTDALGLISLLGAGVGIAAMFRELTTRAVIRELGSAYHSGDNASFARVYNSALFVSTIAAVAAGLTFAALYACIPLLEITEALRPAARWIVLSQGGFVVLSVLMAPVFNMFVVQERFVAHNLWTLADRAAFLGAALVIRASTDETDVAQLIRQWTITVSAAEMIVLIVPAAHLMLSQPVLRPRPSLARRAALREVLSTLKWYVLVELSSNLYERVGALIMNAFFHLRGNTIFGVALNFTSYIRQTTQGVTFGLEAVSARLHATRRDTMPVLMRHSTRLHALAALPTGVLVAALAHPLIELWLRQEEARPLIPQIATTVQVLSLALTTRAISDGWMMILYGAGHIRRYAPLVFAGGVVCPALSAVLTPVMPEPLDLYTVAAMFSLVYTLAHFILLPRVAAKCLGLRYGEIFAPLFRPVIALLAALPVLIVAAASISTWTLLTTAVAAAAFGTAYVIAAYCIVLTREEKERFVLAPIRARIPRVNRR